MSGKDPTFGDGILDASDLQRLYPNITPVYPLYNPYNPCSFHFPFHYPNITPIYPSRRLVSQPTGSQQLRKEEASVLALPSVHLVADAHQLAEARFQTSANCSGLGPSDSGFRVQGVSFQNLSLGFQGLGSQGLAF